MELLDTLRRLFAYDEWANGETLSSLREATPVPERALSVLAHIVGAHEVWLSRLGQAPDVAEPWPTLDVDGLAARLTEVAERWRVYVESLQPDDLAVRMTYTNSKGETFSYLLSDVLLHVALHGAYHRGQVASLLRSAGGQPVNTDYTRAARLGVTG